MIYLAQTKWRKRKDNDWLSEVRMYVTYVQTDINYFCNSLFLSLEENHLMILPLIWNRIYVTSIIKKRK